MIAPKRESNMSNTVVPFPKRQQATAPVTVVEQTNVERLSEEFLRRAVAMHMSGEAGVDVYRAMIMALTKLICHAESDPAVIERRLAASHAHILEAREVLTSAAAASRG
jgi:hypothetical protein